MKEYISPKMKRKALNFECACSVNFKTDEWTISFTPANCYFAHSFCPNCNLDVLELIGNPRDLYEPLKKKNETRTNIR